MKKRTIRRGVKLLELSTGLVLATMLALSAVIFYDELTEEARIAKAKDVLIHLDHALREYRVWHEEAFPNQLDYLGGRNLHPDLMCIFGPKPEDVPKKSGTKILEANAYMTTWSFLLEEEIKLLSDYCLTHLAAPNCVIKEINEENFPMIPFIKFKRPDGEEVICACFGFGSCVKTKKDFIKDSPLGKWKSKVYGRFILCISIKTKKGTGRSSSGTIGIVPGGSAGNDPAEENGFKLIDYPRIERIFSPHGRELVNGKLIKACEN